MSDPRIFALIKTECGRSKYLELVKKKNLYGLIRLYWFIFFAIIKDSVIPANDYKD